MGYTIKPACEKRSERNFFAIYILDSMARGLSKRLPSSKMEDVSKRDKRPCDEILTEGQFI